MSPEPDASPAGPTVPSAPAAGPLDLDRLVTRRGTGSLKWDTVGPDELPMWVADMDLPTAPAVTAALRGVVERGTHGYATIGDDYREAVVGWWRHRHGWDIDPEWIVPTTGAVAALSSIVRWTTHVAESVVTEPPVYGIFTASVVNNGRRVLPVPLLEHDGAWQHDWDSLEEALARPTTTLMVLCNPHNPVGRVWTPAEHVRLADLADRHHVTVVSDEVHGDVTAPGVDYTPFASVSEQALGRAVTLLSPSKAFNLAGLHTASAVIGPRHLRGRVERGLNTDEVAEPGVMAAPATVAAYTAGADWLDAVRAYVAANKALVAEVVDREVPGLYVPPSEATYLVWIDCRRLVGEDGDTTTLVEHLRATTGLVVTAGRGYGEAGRGFLRMNVGTQRSRVRDGLDRLVRGAASFRPGPGTPGGR